MNKYKPYGKNILIKPTSKDKVIGDSSKFYLFGEVLDVGSEVKKIKKGDTIGHTLWGLNKIVEANGIEHFFVQDNDDFILGIIENEN